MRKAAKNTDSIILIIGSITFEAAWVTKRVGGKVKSKSPEPPFHEFPSDRA